MNPEFSFRGGPYIEHRRCPSLIHPNETAGNRPMIELREFEIDHTRYNLWLESTGRSNECNYFAPDGDNRVGFLGYFHHADEQ